MWSSRRWQRRNHAHGLHPADQPRLGNVVSHSHGLAFELPRELARSRRHGHQLSLILLRDGEIDAPAGSRRTLHDVIDRLALRLRLSDLLIRLDDRRLLVACPETGAGGARVLMTDLIGLAAAEGVTARAGTATFPTSALNASELLRACEHDLTLDPPRRGGHPPRRGDLHALTRDRAQP